MLRDLLSIYLVLNTRFLFSELKQFIPPSWFGFIVSPAILWIHHSTLFHFLEFAQKIFWPCMFVCNPASLQEEKGENICWCFRTVKQLVDVNIIKDMPHVQNFLLIFRQNLIFFPVWHGRSVISAQQEEQKLKHVKM